MGKTVVYYPEDTPVVIHEGILKAINSISSPKELTCLIIPLNRFTNRAQF